MHRICALIVVAGLMAVPLMSSAQTTTSYTYDDLGRLKGSSRPGAQSGYNYDVADNRKSVITVLPNGPNQAPVCSARTITLTVPANVSIPVFTLNPITALPACTDANGNILTLVSVTSPATMGANDTASLYNVVPGYNATFSYTVSDGNGGTVTSTVTLIRQNL